MLHDFWVVFMRECDFQEVLGSHYLCFVKFCIESSLMRFEGITIGHLIVKKAREIFLSLDVGINLVLNQVKLCVFFIFILSVLC